MASRRPRPKADEPEAVAGIGVDAFGGPTIDPSANTVAGLAGAVARIDDLRRETDRRYDRELWWTRYVAEMRAAHYKELSIAESKRIDAIRVVDVNAVAVAQARTADQATVLANQVQASAEALRSLVASSAKALADAQALNAAEYNKRLQDLERAKSEDRGRSTVADPMLEKLVARMESLAETRSEGRGKSAGMSITAKIAIAGVSLIATLLGIVVTLGAAWALLQP